MLYMTKKISYIFFQVPLNHIQSFFFFTAPFLLFLLSFIKSSVHPFPISPSIHATNLTSQSYLSSQLPAPFPLHHTQKSPFPPFLRNTPINPNLNPPLFFNLIFFNKKNWHKDGRVRGRNQQSTKKQTQKNKAFRRKMGRDRKNEQTIKGKKVWVWARVRIS